MVIITDNNEEDIHKIFPIERTKAHLQEVTIPAILISQQDAKQFEKAIELSQSNHSPNDHSNVEIAVYF